MKKAFVVVLAAVLALALTGCSGEELEDKVNSAFDSIEKGFDSIEDGMDKLDDKINGREEPAPEPEPTEGPASEPAASDDTIRPEIKEAIDSYEAFFNEYADFMASYDATDVSALTKYLSMAEQYTDMMQKLDDMEDADLTDAEARYYAQAMLRIEQRLLEVSGEMAG